MLKPACLNRRPLVDFRLAPLSARLSRAKTNEVGYPRTGTKSFGRGRQAFAPRATKVEENVLEVGRAQGVSGARFSVPVHLEFGDRVVIVGSDPALGSWAIEDAVLLEWTDGDVWEGIVDLVPGYHEFKCVVLNNNGLIWESGPNRTVTISPPGGDTKIRCQMWDTTTTLVESRGCPAPEAQVPTDCSPEKTLVELLLVADGHIIPHAEKIKSGGEDAFFVSEAGYGAIGVADGVSGWSKNGIDPAIYPQTLLYHSKLAFENDSAGLGAVELMMLGQNRTKLIGSCTACLATMKSGNKLEIANLGDSGFRLIREGMVFQGSKVQEESFNFPYQLGHPSLMPKCQSSTDADRYTIDVQRGDILVMGSDGLFDNIWDEDLTAIVVASMTNRSPSQESAKDISSALAQAAHANALDNTCYVPWTIDVTKEAKKRGLLSDEIEADDINNPYKGGKMDDCCVVVAFICHK